LYGGSHADQDAINNSSKIWKLCTVNQKVDGYHNVIKAMILIILYAVLNFWTTAMCALLYMACVNAWRKMIAVTWQECCWSACWHLNIVEIKQADDFNIILRWNITFCYCKTFSCQILLLAKGNFESPIFDLWKNWFMILVCMCA